MVRIEIQGSGIENVELLPESGSSPLYARGTVTGDKTGAYIDFNTSALPDGPVTIRVAAFNAPPGQAGSEITAMPARTWTIKNATTFEASLVSAPPNDAFLGFEPYGQVARFEVRGAGMRNVELVSSRDESIIYGRFTVSPDGSAATFDWRFYETQRLYEEYLLRVVAWDSAPGQPGRRIEVMPARRYILHLPLGCYSVPTCGGTAP